MVIGYMLIGLIGTATGIYIAYPLGLIGIVVGYLSGSVAVLLAATARVCILDFHERQDRVSRVGDLRRGSVGDSH